MHGLGAKGGWGPHCERPCFYPESEGILGGFNHGCTVIGFVSWEANARDTVESTDLRTERLGVEGPGGELLRAIQPFLLG